jgi:trimeric autotransporter adhesin
VRWHLLIPLTFGVPIGIGLTAASPQMAAADTGCTSSGTVNVTVTCNPGIADTWTVPAGVSQATFTVEGAPGGNVPATMNGFVEGGSGGQGGELSAIMTVVPASTYDIEVGTTGGNATNPGPPTYNDGTAGSGGAPGGAVGDCVSEEPTMVCSAGGGGASIVALGGTSPADWLLVAGGGGGAGISGNGGNGGGQTGQAGPGFLGGSGGTQSCSPASQPDGSVSSSAGGGGGGGYCGGMGPTVPAGGGGGSGFITAEALSGSMFLSTTNSDTTGGSVVVTYTLKDTTTTSLAASPGSEPYGNEAATNFTVTVMTGEGQTINPTSLETVTVDVGSTSCMAVLSAAPGVGATGTCSIGATALAPDSYEASATYMGDDDFYASPSAGTAAFEVTEDSTTTSLAASPGSEPYGNEGATSFTVTVTTYYGEVIPSSTETVTVDVGSTSCIATLAPDVGVGGEGSCSIGNAVLSVGDYTASAMYSGDDDLSASPTAGTTGFDVTQESQTITFNPPPTALFGSTITLSATGGASGNPVVFSSSSAACYLSGTNDSVVTFIGSGSCVLEANQAGNTDYSAALEVTRTIDVAYSAPCISTYHSLTVHSGEALCLSPGADIEGSITVEPGGSLDIEGAKVNGSITTNGAGVVRICGSKINGPVAVSSSRGPVIIGDDEGATCSGNTISGMVGITSNTSGIEFDYNTVNGPLTITDNTGYVMPPDSGSVVVVGDMVAGTKNVQ